MGTRRGAGRIARRARTASEAAAGWCWSLARPGSQVGAASSFTDRWRTAKVLTGWCDPTLDAPTAAPSRTSRRPGTNVSHLLQSGQHNRLFERSRGRNEYATAPRARARGPHWADALDLDLVTFLARRVDTTRLLSWRPSDDEVADGRAGQHGSARSAGARSGSARRRPVASRDRRLAEGTAFDPAESTRGPEATHSSPRRCSPLVTSSVPAKAPMPCWHDRPLSPQSTARADLRRRPRSPLRGQRAARARRRHGRCPRRVRECGLLRFSPPSFEFRHELARRCWSRAPSGGRVACTSRPSACLPARSAPTFAGPGRAPSTPPTPTRCSPTRLRPLPGRGLGAHARRPSSTAARSGSERREPEERARLQRISSSCTRVSSKRRCRSAASLDQHARRRRRRSGSELRSSPGSPGTPGEPSTRRPTARGRGPGEPRSQCSTGDRVEHASQLAMVQGDADRRRARNQALAMASAVGDDGPVDALNNIGTSLTSGPTSRGSRWSGEPRPRPGSTSRRPQCPRLREPGFAAVSERDDALLDRHLDRAIAHCESHEVEVQRLYLEAAGCSATYTVVGGIGSSRRPPCCSNSPGALAGTTTSRPSHWCSLRLRTGLPRGRRWAATALADELDEPQRRVRPRRRRTAWLDGRLADLLDELGARPAATTWRPGASRSFSSIRRGDPSYPAPDGPDPTPGADTSLDEAAATWQRLGCP